MLSAIILKSLPKLSSLNEKYTYTNSITDNAYRFLNFYSACFVWMTNFHLLYIGQSQGSLRLVLANGIESPFDNIGYLQAYYNGRWGRVCDSTGTFRQEEANVACRQLGYDRANEFTTIASSASFLE